MDGDFRIAREHDLERLLEIHSRAFPDPRGREARLRNFTHNALGRLDDLYVLAEGDSLVAHAFLFPLEAYFGGARVRVGGIATVGVAPEARGRGVGTRILGHLHAASRARGDALTLLYAFRQGFYGRIGYAMTSPYHRLRIHPASIPWRAELALRPAAGHHRQAMERSWEAVAARRTGALARDARRWDARLLDERRTWIVAEGAGGVEGYVAWTLAQLEPHGTTTLIVEEMVAETQAAERSLWAVVGAQRDQVAEVRVDVGGDDPLERALIDADRARPGDAQVEHVLGEVASGPMLRLTDLSRALEARGWSAEGTLVLEVDGARLEVTASGGRARCVPSTASPQVRVGASVLAAIAFGGLPATQASRLGWLEARSDADLGRAEALLRIPPFFSPESF